MNKRKATRLKEYDYAQNGAYFITICTQNKQCILSDIIVGASIARPCEIQLTQIGIVVENSIKGIEKHYQNVFVENYVIMPNHIHMIIRIDNSGGRAMLAPTISRIIQQFKGYVTKQIGKSIWQKLFYDHIIRDEDDYIIKIQYIENNPSKWFEDKYYTKKE